MAKYRCMTCTQISDEADLINRPWMGWDAEGTLIPVPNHCCPNCGSNDLVMRAEPKVEVAVGS